MTKSDQPTGDSALAFDTPEDQIKEAIEDVLLKIVRELNLNMDFSPEKEGWRSGPLSKKLCKSRSNIWRYDCTNTSGTRTTLLLKGYYVSGEHDEVWNISNKAMRMAARHRGLSIHRFAYLFGQDPAGKFFRYPNCSENNANEAAAAPTNFIIVEGLDFIKGSTYGDLLPDLAKKQALSALDENIIRATAKMFDRIHSVKPTLSDFSDLPADRFEAEQMTTYSDSIRNLIERMDYYAPIELDHPYITAAIRQKLSMLGHDLVKKWWDRWQCICAQQGDARAQNEIVIFKGSGKIEVRPIDFSRVEWCHRCYDDGRFVADLLEYAIASGSPRYRELIDIFICESERLSGDREYRQALCIGIFSMLFIKLDPRGTPIEDPEVAKRYLDFCLRVLEQGYFSWE